MFTVSTSYCFSNAASHTNTQSPTTTLYFSASTRTVLLQAATWLGWDVDFRLCSGILYTFPHSGTRSYMRHVLLMVDHRTQKLKPNHTGTFIDSAHSISANITLAKASHMASININRVDNTLCLHGVS